MRKVKLVSVLELLALLLSARSGMALAALVTGQGNI